jgi:membrane protein YdbS with pleckstrin-like domain
MDFLFPAFFDRPANIRFAQQEENEVIELLLRKHWITNVGWILTALLVSLIPFFLVIFGPYFGTSFFVTMPANVLTAILLAYYLLVLVYVVEEFLSWYFNIYIVTNMHLVDVNFYNLLLREVVEAGLENVESASSKISGLLQSFFNFGDVVVQTAAEHQQITFLDIPYPDVVTDRIDDLKSSVERSLETGT